MYHKNKVTSMLSAAGKSLVSLHIKGTVPDVLMYWCICWEKMYLLLISNHKTVSREKSVGKTNFRSFYHIVFYESVLRNYWFCKKMWFSQSCCKWESKLMIMEKWSGIFCKVHAYQQWWWSNVETNKKRNG